MTVFSQAQWGVVMLLALGAAGCFEVAPLPDGVALGEPECADDDVDCEDEPECVDGEEDCEGEPECVDEADCGDAVDCVDEADCLFDEVCAAGICEVDDYDPNFVLLSVYCTGVPDSVVGVQCGGSVFGEPCSGNGEAHLFECPIEDQISVCCGESGPACSRQIDAKSRVEATSIVATPSDGWDCDDAPDPAALTCTHSGFEPSREIVTEFECDVSVFDRDQ